MRTVAGYILDRIGTIPKTGTELELGDSVITITDADARAIRKNSHSAAAGTFLVGCRLIFKWHG